MYIHVSPKLESKHSPIAGGGLFARVSMNAGEVLFDTSEIGDENIISKEEADKRFQGGFDYMLQIGDDQFLVTVDENSPDYHGHINHSCDPNCGVKESRKIVAMRDIHAGEEITFDYAMTESSDYTLNCLCGSYNCRRIVGGGDWKRKDLQDKYRGYFSEYVQKKIDKNKIMNG